MLGRATADGGGLEGGHDMQMSLTTNGAENSGLRGFLVVCFDFGARYLEQASALREFEPTHTVGQEPVRPNTLESLG